MQGLSEKVRTAGRGPDRKQEAGREPEQDAAEEGDQEKIVRRENIGIWENIELRRVEDEAEEGPKEAPLPVYSHGVEENRDVHDHVRNPEGNLKGKGLVRNIFDDDGKAGNASGDQAGRVEDVLDVQSQNRRPQENNESVPHPKLRHDAVMVLTCSACCRAI